MTMDSQVDVSEAAQDSPTAPRTRKHTILFLAANPLGTDRLALDEEARAIQQELECSSWREHFELVARWAVRPMDLLRELRKLKPTIVHFSGHGTSASNTACAASQRDATNASSESAIESTGGLYFQGQDSRPMFLPKELLRETFEAAGASVKLVVLCACYSEAQAEALLSHVGCVIAVSGAIRDHAARTFAVGFYGGLAERESVQISFKQGVAAMRLTELGQIGETRSETSLNSAATDAMVQLLARPETNPGKFYFVYGPRTRRRCTIVIKANLADFDSRVIERVRDQLRLLSGDVSLEIIEVQEGSVRLMASLSPEGAARLITLRHSESLAKICEFAISSIEVTQWEHIQGQDLSKADLSGINLERADLSAAELFRADLSGGNLRGANLSGANLVEAKLSGVNLEGSNLKGACVIGARLFRTNLGGANLSGTILSDAALFKANLRGATLINATLSSAHLNEASLEGADLRSADLRSAHLGRAKLEGANLSGARLFSADLRSADLRSADLRSADLRSADLEGANLEGANLEDANLEGANLSPASLLSEDDISDDDISEDDISDDDISPADFTPTDLSGAILNRANLSGANLSGANLSGANLSGANLSGANLSGANLSRANLIVADLRDADLRGANCTDANLSGTNVEGARFGDEAAQESKKDIG